MAGSVSTHYDLAELSAFHVFARKECLDHSLQANGPFVNVQVPPGKTELELKVILLKDSRHINYFILSITPGKQLSLLSPIT